MSQQNKVSYAVISKTRISEKNLLPTCKNNGATQGITFEVRPDGSVYAHGTATGTAYGNFVHSGDPIPLPAGEYNISPGTNLSVGYIAIARADDRTILATSSTKESGTNTRFTLTEETQIYAYLRFPVNAVVDAVIYPQLEAGSVATEYEPYEIIEGFTRKIKKKYLVIDGVTKKLTKKYSCVPKLVGYSEKNLLPAAAFDVYENNGIVYTRNIDGSIHAKGTATARSICNLLNHNQGVQFAAETMTYSAGKNLPSGAGVIFEYYNGNTWVSAHPSLTDWAPSRTAEFVAGYDYGVYISIAEGTTIDHVFYPQLERGSVATEYEPYEIWKSFTRLVYSATEDISAAEITLASGTLTYNGSSQTKKVSSVVLNGKTLVEGTDYTVSGNTGTNAGSYTLTITGIGDYEGTASTAWSIAQAAGSISVSPTSLSIVGAAGTTKTATITYTGDGSISVKSSDTGTATVTRSGNTVTVKSVDTGSAIVTITLAAGTNYTGASCTISVTAKMFSSTLADNTWAQIAEASAAGVASELWDVGDSKTETMAGAIYTFRIAGFDHDNLNSADAKFGDTSYNGGKNKAGITFEMAQITPAKYKMHSASTTVNNWEKSYMRSSVMKTMKGYLPSEVTSVLRTVTKLSLSANISPTVVEIADELFLLSRSEVIQTTSGDYAAEGTQYAYYKAGNSRIKNKRGGSAEWWWLRTPVVNYQSVFSIGTDGSLAEKGYTNEMGVSFAFCI